MTDKIEYFQLNAGRYTYYMSITTKYNMFKFPLSHGIDVGGTMKGCLRVTIEVPNPKLMNDERFAELEKKKKQAFISWIGYNKKCSLTNNLISGDGTRHMLRSVMTYILQNYKWIEQFTLLDESNAMCDNVLISLSRLSLALNGKTYYEKYLGARLLDDRHKETYYASIKTLDDPNEKLDYNLFISQFPINPVIAQSIKNAYEKTSTYKEFFQYLRNTDPNRFCSLVSNWLNSFIDSIVDENTWLQKWVIKRDSVKMIPVEASTILDEPLTTKAQSIIQEEFKPYYSQIGGTALLGRNDF